MTYSVSKRSKGLGDQISCIASRKFHVLVTNQVIEVPRAARHRVSSHGDDVAGHARINVRSEEAGRLIWGQAKTTAGHRARVSSHEKQMHRHGQHRMGVGN